VDEEEEKEEERKEDWKEEMLALHLSEL